MIGADQLSGLDAVLSLTPRWTAASVAGADQLVGVARFGVGYDTVDIAACTRKGVAVGVTNGANDLAVAEHTMMLMLAVAQPFMGTHFALGGVLRGAGDTVTPFLGAAVGNLCFRVPLAWVFARVLGAPLAWVWSALVFDHMARLAINGTVFLRGRWAQRVGVLP